MFPGSCLPLEFLSFVALINSFNYGELALTKDLAVHPWFAFFPVFLRVNISLVHSQLMQAKAYAILEPGADSVFHGFRCILVDRLQSSAYGCIYARKKQRSVHACSMPLAGDRIDTRCTSLCMLSNSFTNF